MCSKQQLNAGSATSRRTPVLTATRPSQRTMPDWHCWQAARDLYLPRQANKSPTSQAWEVRMTVLFKAGQATRQGCNVIGNSRALRVET